MQSNRNLTKATRGKSSLHAIQWRPFAVMDQPVNGSLVKLVQTNCAARCTSELLKSRQRGILVWIGDRRREGNRIGGARRYGRPITAIGEAAQGLGTPQFASQLLGALKPSTCCHRCHASRSP